MSHNDRYICSQQQKFIIKSTKNDRKENPFYVIYMSKLLYSEAHLCTQRGLWSQTPRKGLDSLIPQSCPDRKAPGGFGYPWLSTSMLKFSQVSERVTSLQLQVAAGKALIMVCAFAPDSSSD